MYSRPNSHLNFPRETSALLTVHLTPFKHATAFQIPEVKYISEMSYAYRSCYLYSAPRSSHLPFLCHYYLFCTVHSGHRPHFPLVLKTTWNTISLVKSFTGMPYRAASFPSNSIIPTATPQGLWLAEVFTCLKMYQAKNRSHFLSILWCWICSFLFLSICQIDK